MNEYTWIVDKPALILWGMKDIAFREKELQKWQQFFNNAQVRRFEGASHFVQEEHGQEVVPIVAKFLR